MNFLIGVLFGLATAGVWLYVQSDPPAPPVNAPSRDCPPPKAAYESGFATGQQFKDHPELAGWNQ